MQTIESPPEIELSTSEKRFEKLSLLYQENARVAAIFWEWRHKVMTSFFAGMAALVALAGWFYQQDGLHALLPPSLFLGSILSFVSFFLDQRNAKILRETYRVGKGIEHDLIQKGAIFEAIGESHYTSVTYTVVLGVVYFLIGVLLLVAAFGALKLIQ